MSSSSRAECTLCLKEERQHDPHYRYKMPPINASTDNRSKQRKTYLHNVTAIAANCFRPEEWLLKFLALQLSTDSGNSSAGGAAFLTGHHVTAVLQPIVFCFIQEYVLCSKCGSPETLLYVEGKKRDKVSRLQCHSCGRSSRSAGQNAKMLNLFAAQPMRPELCAVGRRPDADSNTPLMTIEPDAGGNGMQINEAAMASAPSLVSTRLLFVRHGKQQLTGERSAADRKDPPLSEQGHRQAAQRAEELAAELASVQPRLVISSPMRRALMTAAPTATALSCTLLVHGACFEYGCAGTEFRGSGKDAIEAIRPDATLTHLGPAGEWDYTSSSTVESEQEAKQRARRVASWLRHEVVPELRGGAVVLVAHQTFLDLLLQLLLTGSDDRFCYGMPRHKLVHTGLFRVRAHQDGHFEEGEG